MRLILLAVLLTGCATTMPTRPIVQREHEVIEHEVYVGIDPKLTEALPVYERAAETFGEAWQQAEHNTKALKDANAKLAEIAKIQGTEPNR